MKLRSADAPADTIDLPNFLKQPQDAAAAAAANDPTPSVAASSPSAHYGNKPLVGDLPNDGFERMFVLRLRGLDAWSSPDIADRFYEAPGVWMGAGDRIVNQDSGERRQRLRSMLAESSTLGVVLNRRTLRTDYQKFTPQDFIVLIPRPVYDSYLDLGAVPIAHLNDRLRERIEQDFGRRFVAPLRGANVSTAPADLPIDEAIILFGPTVFVPNERDVQEFAVSVAVTADGGVLRPKEGFAHTIVTPAPGMRACDCTIRPAGLYRGQSSFLIGTDEITAPNMLPRQLGLPPGLTALISLSPDRARGDGTHLAREGRAETLADGTRIFRLVAAQPSRTPGRKLSLEVTLRPVRTQAARIDAIERKKDAADRDAPAKVGFLRRLFARKTDAAPALQAEPKYDPRQEPKLGERVGRDMPQAAGETIVVTPGVAGFREVEPLPFARLSGYRASVVAVAPPRLPGGVGGPVSWSFAVTPSGEITPRPSGAVLNADHRLALLGGKAGDPRLYVIPGGKRDWQAVDPAEPPRLHPDGAGAALLPLAEPLTEHRHMLLTLPQPRHFPLLADGEQLIGRRSDAAHSPGAATPKIQFGLLDLPGSVEGAPHGSLEVVNLSRDHVRAVVAGDQLKVFMHAGRTPVWRLDAAFKPLEEMRPGQTDPLTLNAGEHLLIGCYVVRFALAAME